MIDRTYPWSLRRRVTLIAAIATCTALLICGFALHWAERVKHAEALDAGLERLATIVLWIIEDRLAVKGDSVPTVQAHHMLPPSSALMYRYQVWSRDGTLLMRSNDASPAKPLSPLNHVGFSSAQVDDEDFRTFSLASGDGRLIVQVAERSDGGAVESGELAGYFWGLLLTLGLVFSGMWWMLGRTFRAVDTIAENLRHRNPLDVTRISADRVPLEIRPLLRALNALFGRVANANSVERRFTSMAAQEMRTPLAGIRAQAQILGFAPLPQESQRALKLLLQGVDRSSRMVEQILDLARVEGMGPEGERRDERVGLFSTYRDVMRDLGARATAKGIRIEARFDTGYVDGPGVALSMDLLLRNLIANAILYTPEGGRVEVEGAVRSGGDVVITVDDSGSGIPESERERAFERFNRLGQSGTAGAGLGLSIVLLVVEAQGGLIKLLDSPLGGLRVKVRLPQTQAQPTLQAQQREIPKLQRAPPAPFGRAPQSPQLSPD
jgi:signal transduction histidine kinase